MFHFDSTFGLFVGKLNTNEFHKHYAFQLSVSLHERLQLSIHNEAEQLGTGFYIASNVAHKLISSEEQLTILINPLSSLGHYLHIQFGKNTFQQVPKILEQELLQILAKLTSKEISFQEFCSLINEVLVNFRCSCENEIHLNDDRILNILSFIEADVEKIYSLEEVAERTFLSPSRFLHLFKEKTGLNFRRYQLWNKLIKSLPYLRTHSITETAHTFGFTDSSHYSRTFKETFGLNPKFLIPKD